MPIFLIPVTEVFEASGDPDSSMMWYIDIHFWGTHNSFDSYLKNYYFAEKLADVLDKNSRIKIHNYDFIPCYYFCDGLF